MAISYVGGASANSTTVALPAGAAAGDLAVVAAGRANAGGPGIPGGWTDLGVLSGGSGGTAHGQRAGWKILEAADISAGDVGSWSSAAEIIVGVYRGAGVVGANSGTGANGTSVSHPARSGLAAGSWQVALSTHRSATNVHSLALTGYTVRSGSFTSTRAGLRDSNGPTSGLALAAMTVNASSGNVGRTLEITAGSVELAGSSAGVSGATGELTVTRTLDGIADGISSSTGLLTVERSLAGRADGVSTATGVLIVPIQIAGSTGGTSGATGVLSITRGLEGAAAGVSSLTVGPMTVARSLSGVANGVATATGALTAARSFSGRSDGVATATGLLRVTRTFTGRSDAVATLTGVLGVRRMLTGRADGISSLTGELLTDIAAPHAKSPLDFVVAVPLLDFVATALVPSDFTVNPSEGDMAVNSGEQDLSNILPYIVEFLVMQVGVTNMVLSNDGTRNLELQ